MSSNGQNWGKLYEAGRCKAIGVSWSDEEAYAALILKIPADYVRLGCLTWDDYEKALGKRKETEERTQKVQVIHLKRSQLASMCRERGIVVTDEVLRPSLIEMLFDAGCPKSIPIEDVPKALENEL